MDAISEKVKLKPDLDVGLPATAGQQVLEILLLKTTYANINLNIINCDHDQEKPTGFTRIFTSIDIYGRNVERKVDK